MKAIYWNVKGLENTPIKLSFKKLQIDHKPEFCFISEPRMDHNVFLKDWLNMLNLLCFVVIQRNNLLPNLWRCCSK